MHSSPLREEKSFLKGLFYGYSQTTRQSKNLIYPVELAAQTAVAAVMEYLQSNPDVFERIKWVLHDAKTMAAYQIALENVQ